MDQLHTIASQFPLLTKLESLSHNRVKREHILLGAGVLSVVLTLGTPLGPLITSTVGVLVPLHETMACLKKRAVQRHHVIFWMVFGLLTALDAYSYFIVRLIPFFYTIKLVALLWAGPIRFGAGEFIYENFLGKVPEQYYSFERAEDIINQAAKVATDAVKKGKEITLDDKAVKKDDKKNE